METPYHAKVAAGAISASSKRREGDDIWEAFTGRKQRQQMNKASSSGNNDNNR